MIALEVRNKRAWELRFVNGEADNRFVNAGIAKESFTNRILRRIRHRKQLSFTAMILLFSYAK